ncbi:hypothetical protein QE152_g9252 [Popillia japonica]|uniref:Retrovirus-related pol polyprotein from transposon tnt 1-94 n=1 Tax=Popillia japonica TaxID=7064 RepID=A0AAW1M1U2_POPJA
MEAEYVAASEASKSLAWLDRLLKEIGWTEETPSPVLYIDNQSAIKYIKNPRFHERSKHIDTRYHYIKQLVREKKIMIEYIPAEQAAAIFTKGLSVNKLSVMKLKVEMTNV